jgi:hypothetical protein
MVGYNKYGKNQYRILTPEHKTIKNRRDFVFDEVSKVEKPKELLSDEETKPTKRKA